MAESFNRNRTATVRPDLSRIQAGWTVYDALDRPVGNATDVDTTQLRVDGRPEGLGYFSVSTDLVRDVRDGSIHLSLEMDQLASADLAAAPPPSRLDAPVAAMLQLTDDVEETSATRRATVTAPPAPPAQQEDHLHGSSYTSSGTPLGQGSNTPVGDEPDSFRAWDTSVEHSLWSRLSMLAAPVGIGVASAAGYLWWRNRQARRGRLARLSRALASAGDSMTPVLDAASGRKSAWWLASLSALPLAYYLRTRGANADTEAMPASSLPDENWRHRFPALLAALPTASLDLALPDSIEPPPTWTAAIPVIAAGLAAAWYAARSRGRSRQPTQQIRTIMTRNVEIIRPDATVFEAATAMRRLDVGFLPVCDGRRLQGVITDRDIVVRPVANSLDPHLTPVRDAMSPDLVYAYDNDPIQRAADLMRQHQIRRLPIVDRNKSLVGVVSLGDLAVDTGNDRLSGSTLERISEPARPAR